MKNSVNVKAGVHALNPNSLVTPELPSDSIHCWPGLRQSTARSVVGACVVGMTTTMTSPGYISFLTISGSPLKEWLLVFRKRDIVSVPVEVDDMLSLTVSGCDSVAVGMMECEAESEALRVWVTVATMLKVSVGF